MPGTTIKHKRKAGAFSGGELAQGEWGFDITNARWYYSADGSTVTMLGGSGDVVGPSSSTNNNVALFDGTTGKLLKDAGKGLPSGAIVGTTDTQTLTNKTLTTPTIGSFANASHNHQDSAGGGTLDAAAIASGSLAQARQSILASGAYLIAPWEQYPAGNVSCTAASANSVSVVAFIPKATISVLSIHFDVQVLFSGGLCSVGVYSANGNTKLIDSGTKSTTSTGVQSTTLGAAVTLYANTLYWIAYTHDNTTSAIRGIVAALTGATNILNAGTVQVGTAANAATAGALPSSLGVITGASRPIPMIKLQG